MTPQNHFFTASLAETNNWWPIPTIPCLILIVLRGFPPPLLPQKQQTTLEFTTKDTIHFFLTSHMSALQDAEAVQPAPNLQTPTTLSGIPWRLSAGGGNSTNRHKHAGVSWAWSRTWCYHIRWPGAPSCPPSIHHPTNRRISKSSPSNPTEKGTRNIL